MGRAKVGRIGGRAGRDLVLLRCELTCCQALLRTEVAPLEDADRGQCGSGTDREHEGSGVGAERLRGHEGRWPSGLS